MISLKLPPEKTLKINVLSTRAIRLAPIVGIGYWKDVYDEEVLGIGGWQHNVVLPFIRIHWGVLMSLS